MGQALVEYFRRAERLGGVPAMVRLASLTLTTSMQARVVDDTPELIGRFDRAFDQLVAGAPSVVTPVSVEPVPRPASPPGDRFLSVVTELVHQRDLFLHDPLLTMQRVTEACASALPVARSGVWLFDDAGAVLACRNLFESAHRRHSSGLAIARSDAPAYFRALGTERVIDAADAIQDPRTAEFGGTYLRPLRIGALLDVPLWSRGRMVGVLCSEQVGGARSWTRAEADFCLVAAGLVSIALERGGRDGAGPA